MEREEEEMDEEKMKGRGNGAKDPESCVHVEIVESANKARSSPQKPRFAHLPCHALVAPFCEMEKIDLMACPESLFRI